MRLDFCNFPITSFYQKSQIFLAEWNELFGKSVACDLAVQLYDLGWFCAVLENNSKS